MQCSSLPSTAVALIAGGLLAASASAQEFAPNHIWVAGTNNTNDFGALFEFDQSGVLLRTIDVTPDDILYGLAFGPDGNIYVGGYSGDTVFSVTPTGVITPVIDSSDGLDGPDGLSFGPDGTLWVGSRESASLIYKSVGQPAAAITFPTISGAPGGVTFGADGHMWVQFTSGSGELVEMDSSLRTIRSFATGTLGSYPGMPEVGRDGLMYVPDWAHGAVAVMDHFGSLANTIGAGTSDGAYSLCFAPNGNLLVCDWPSEVDEYLPNGTFVRSIDDSTCDASFVAISPFRFKTKLVGTRAMDDEAAKTRSESVTLSLCPGSNRLMVELSTTPLAGGAASSGTLFGTWNVFRGFESFDDIADKKRLIHGSSAMAPLWMNGVASIDLVVSGKPDANGWWTVKSAKGSFHRPASFGGLNVKVTTSKLLK